MTMNQLHTHCMKKNLIIIYRPRSLCIVHVGFAENGLENLPCPSSLLLGVLVTLLPKMVPRLMPYFLGSATAEVKSRFSDPQYFLESEEVFREKFVENLKMVE